MGTRTVSNTINLQNPGEQVSKYITDITSEGIYVHSSDTPSNPSALTAKGIKIANRIDMIRNGISVASYGELITIGRENETRAEIDYHSLQLIDKEGTTYFHVSDLRDLSGKALVQVFFIGDGFSSDFLLNLEAVGDMESVTIDDVITTDYTNTQNFLEFNTAPANNSVIVATYYTDSASAKAYTFGVRKANEFIGAFSTAEGSNCVASMIYTHAEGYETKAEREAAHAEGESTTASGIASHAEGYGTDATNVASHAEGNYTKASGYGSHAEGDSTTSSGNYSHAEGWETTADGIASHTEGSETTATGSCAHAEGDNSIAFGNFSHAQNQYTNAFYNCQTVIGKYNNNKIDTAFEIGNGSSDNHRSNALAVTWDGNIHMHIDTSIETDEDLIDSITNLGWTDAIIN